MSDTSGLATQVCQFFLQGTCKRGRKCRFAHSTAPTATSPAATKKTGQAPARVQQQQQQQQQQSPARAPTHIVTKAPVATPPAVATTRQATPSPKAEAAKQKQKQKQKKMQTQTQTQKHTPTHNPTSELPSKTATPSPSPAKAKQPTTAPLNSPGPVAKKKNVVCKFFLAGNCTRGSRCAFSHGTATPPVSSTTPVMNAGDGSNGKRRSEPLVKPSHAKAMVDGEGEEAPQKRGKQRSSQSLLQGPSQPTKSAKSAAPTPKPTQSESGDVSSRKSRISYGNMAYVRFLVEKTKAHPRYPDSYSRVWKSTAFDWIDTHGHNGVVLSSTYSPQVVGMDCEMVETTTDKNAVARVTIVAHGRTEYETFPAEPLLLLDLFIKPPDPIVDYREYVSGVTAADLEHAVPLEEAQQAILRIIRRDMVVVGHSVTFDFQALRIRHRHLIDTALLFTAPALGPRSFPLKDVVKEVLGQEAQPTGQSHDCMMDAFWPLELCRWLVDRLVKKCTLNPREKLFDVDNNNALLPHHDIFSIPVPMSFRTTVDIIGFPQEFTEEDLVTFFGTHGHTLDKTHILKFSLSTKKKKISGQAKVSFPSETEAIQFLEKLPIAGMTCEGDVMYVKYVHWRDHTLRVRGYPSHRHTVLRKQLEESKAAPTAPPAQDETAPVTTQGLLPNPSSALPMSTSSAVSTASTTSSSVPVALVSPKFCPNCGTKLGAPCKFCPNCGAKLKQ